MTYAEDHYAGKGPEMPVAYSILSTVQGGSMKITKVHDDAQVYLNFTNIDAASFTVDDGITANTYEFDGNAAYSITIHADCTVTVNGGAADVAYREVVRDYPPLIPEAYGADEEKLHFNLWLTDVYRLGN